MTTNTSTTPAAASSASDPTRTEADDWREMPFVRVENGEIVDHWAPPKITGAAEDNIYTAECSLCASYAMELIAHIKRHARTFDGGSALAPVVAAIVKRGKWTGFEIGFFHALGNHIARGRIPVTPDYDAVEAAV